MNNTNCDSCNSCNYCNSCDYCNSCNYCNYCDSCDYCNSCYYCNSCNSCNSCNFCDSCNYCNYCDSCNSCNFCDYCDYSKNLRMTEKNIFCYSEECNDKDSFQQERYRAFNKVVGEARYEEICIEVGNILKGFKLELDKNDWSSEWEKVTPEQWEALLAIPEAKDFKGGFEFIAGIKIDLEEAKEIKPLTFSADKNKQINKINEIVSRVNELGTLEIQE